LKELGARWVPHLLRKLTKNAFECVFLKRVCSKHSSRFEQNKMDFKRRFITVDET
ncbi:hypothetical protein EAI_03556, partial [Harpegnathos saltator]